MRNLRKGRDFEWWKDYGAAMAAAQNEAMRESGSNQPIGKAYSLEHDRIMRREKLIDYTVEPPLNVRLCGAPMRVVPARPEPWHRSFSPAIRG